MVRLHVRFVRPFLTAVVLASASATLLGQASTGARSGTAAAGSSTAPAAAARAAGRRYAVPRTAEGRPDIQGTWNFSSLTPLERPADFAGRPTMTKEEAAQYQKAVLERNNADRRDGGVDADVARAYNDAWYDRGTGLAVVNGEVHTSLLVDPPDGRLPALTPEATRLQAARAQDRRDHPADNPENRSLGERCFGFAAGPPMLPGPYNNIVQIFPFKDHVVIYHEMIHDARIVYTDGRAHLPQAIRKYMGDSVGRWEGDTLVVDTTNFTTKTAFRGATENMHLVEKFTRTDADTLLYEFTVTDPAAFTRPWTVQLPLKRTDEMLYEYACHEGNEAMLGILRGARFEERQKK